MFNTLKYIKNLEAAGFERAQAEAQVQLVLDAIEVEVATKTDLAELRSDFAELRSEFAELRSDMSQFKAEIRADIAEFKSEIRSDFSEFKFDIVVKLGGVMVTCTTLAVGILGFLIKF